MLHDGSKYKAKCLQEPSSTAIWKQELTFCQGHLEGGSETLTKKADRVLEHAH